MALTLQKIGKDKGIIINISVSEIEGLMDPNKSIGHVLKNLFIFPKILWYAILGPHLHTYSCSLSNIILKFLE